MFVYGCESLPGDLNQQHVWGCDLDPHSVPDELVSTSICGTGKQQFLFLWDKVGGFTAGLPPASSGFKVGGKSRVNHLVLRIHYGDVAGFVKRRDRRLAIGSGGVSVTFQPATAGLRGVGLLTLLSYGHANPHSVVSLAALLPISGCERQELLPVAVTGWTGSHGEGVTVWKVSPSNEWTEVARIDLLRQRQVQLMHQQSVTVREGDSVALRCLLNNTCSKPIFRRLHLDSEYCGVQVVYENQEDDEGNCIPDQTIVQSPGQ